MIEHIKNVEKYEESPSKTPVLIVEELLKNINNKYRLIKLLGIGGEGILIHALNPVGKEVVLKVARSPYQGQYAQTPKQANILNTFSFKNKAKPTNLSYARFLEGAKLQQDVFQMIIDDNETNMAVPSVLDISTDPLFFIMPYMPNINVLRYFKDFNKKFKEILTTFIYLLRGISYIHSKGIIHRDIKSDNILVGNKLKGIVLLDWTFSKQVGDRNLTVMGTQAGTPGFAPIKYMAGEFKNANFLDDIYLLGFTLWEFITGIRLANVWQPGDEKNLNKNKVENFKRKIITKLPECLHQIFWESTEVEESKRIKNVDIFKNKIIDVMNNVEYAGNTLLSLKEVEELQQEAEVIFDTSCDVDLCRECENNLVCKKYGLCNLFKEIFK